MLCCIHANRTKRLKTEFSASIDCEQKMLVSCLLFLAVAATSQGFSVPLGMHVNGHSVRSLSAVARLGPQLRLAPSRIALRSFDIKVEGATGANLC